MKNFLLSLNNNWRNRLILFLVFLFPVLIATVKDAGSTIFMILVALSVFHLRHGWEGLERREKNILIGYALFFFISFLSLFMTEDLRAGIKRAERYVRLVLFIPIYIMFRKERIESGKAFLAGACAAVFVMLGQALYQVEGLKEPISHGAYHKILLGNIAILCSTLIFLGMLFFGKKNTDYLMAVPAILAGVYTSLLSGTRTSWFFVPLIFVALVWLCRKKLNGRAWKAIFLGIGICVLLVGGLQPKRLMEGLAQGLRDLKTFQQDPAKETSWGSRLVMWHNSLLIFKESPVFGTGMGDFKTDSKKLFDRGLSYDNVFASNSWHAHNLYLHLLAEGGLIGLVLMITALFVLPFSYFHSLWRGSSDKWLSFYALSGLVGVLAFAWFGVSEGWVVGMPMTTAYCIVMLVFMTSAANKTMSGIKEQV